MGIGFREINRDTVRAVCQLDAGDGGAQVAPNAVSIAQAHFCTEAWFRAIYHDDDPVGFVMLYDPTLTPEENQYFLWRLMIDKSRQGKGYGHAAIGLLLAHVGTRPGTGELFVSHVRGAEALARFYRPLGFHYAGAEDDGGLVMVRSLA